MGGPPTIGTPESWSILPTKTDTEVHTETKKTVSATATNLIES